jgi:hypothetical protein
MRQPIPHLDNLTYTRYAICWPDGLDWLSVLQGLITQPIRGRMWDERTGSIVGVQSVGYDIDELNSPLEEVILSCGDVSLFVDAINNIAVSLSNSGGDCGCQGAGGTGQYDAPIDTQNIGNQNGPLPVGFTSWPEYLTAKCNVATYIIDKVIADLSNISSVNFTATALAAITPVVVALLITPIPFTRIVALISLFALATGYLGTVAADMRDMIVANYDELVCALTVSTSPEIAISNWQSAIAPLVDVEWPADPLNGLIKQILYLFVGPNSVNRLASPDEAINYPTGDCSGCTCTPEIVHGTLISGDLDTEFTVEGATTFPEGDLTRITITFGCCVQISVEGEDDFQNDSVPFGVEFKLNGVLQYQSDVLPTFGQIYTVDQVVIGDRDTPHDFTIDFINHGQCL